MNSFTNIFGGSAIQPSQPSYMALTIAANTALSWPLETTESALVVAAVLDVTATVGGLLLEMPPANTGSRGVATMVSNVGANTFSVTDTGGNVIAAIAATQSWLIVLTDNATADGTWRALQMASTTSSAVAAALAGPGLQAVGSQLQTLWTTTTLSTNQSIGTAYRSELIVWTGAGGTLQFQASATLTAGFFCAITNEGTGALTITGTGGETVNGQASVVMQPGSSGIFICEAGAFNSVGALVGPVSIANGGTGASTAAAALTNLGGTSIGIAIFTAPSAASIISLLGLGNVNLRLLGVSTNQTLTGSSANTAFVALAPVSLTLPLAETLTTQFGFAVMAFEGAITLIPQTSDAIAGQATGASLVLNTGSSGFLLCDGVANWVLFYSGPGNPTAWSSAITGTSDAIVAAYTQPPVEALVDGMLLGFRATAANTTTTPTFAPFGLTAHTITKFGGKPLAVGDIAGANYEALLRYNLANTRWELLNPASAAGKQLSKAWANFAGASGTVSASFNVSGVVRNSAGNYTISFANALADAHPALAFSQQKDTVAGTDVVMTSVQAVGTGSVTIQCSSQSGGGGSFAAYDPGFVTIMVLGS